MGFRRRENKISTNSTPITGAVLEDILNLDIQKGYASSDTKGWKTVTFPHKTGSPSVHGISSPRSYALSRTQLKVMRREDFITAMSDAAKTAIDDTVGGFSAETKLLWDVAAIWADPVILAPFKTFAGKLYDDIWAPISKEINDSIVKNFGPDILTAAGWEPGRSVHLVQISNIDSSGFDWYSYGTDSNGKTSDIYWISIGTLLQPRQLPQQLQNLLNQYQNQITQLQNEIALLKAQLGL